jgi:ribosomal protein L24E
MGFGPSSVGGAGGADRATAFSTRPRFVSRGRARWGIPERFAATAQVRLLCSRCGQAIEPGAAITRTTWEGSEQHAECPVSASAAPRPLRVVGANARHAKCRDCGTTILAGSGHVVEETGRRYVRCICREACDSRRGAKRSARGTP